MGKLENEMVNSLIDWMERPEREEETVREVAEGIVTALFKFLKEQRKEAPPTIQVGEPFKDTITSKVQTPLWELDGKWWIVNSDSRFGYLGSVDPFVPYAAPTRAAGVKTDNKDGWQVDDKAAWMRSRIVYTVLATSEKSVLLEDDKGSVTVEPNDHMEKYFTRLGKPVKLI